MSARKLLFHEAALERIRRGVDALAEAVKVTLGPRGRTVILEREFGPPQIVNSGVLVAQANELEDPFESMGEQLPREALSTDCMIANAPKGSQVLPSGMAPGF